MPPLSNISNVQVVCWEEMCVMMQIALMSTPTPIIKDLGRTMFEQYGVSINFENTVRCRAIKETWKGFQNGAMIENEKT